MLRRGTKRKAPGDGDGNSAADGTADYARNLSNFRTLARKRESMRLKLQAISAGGDAGGSSAAAQAERQLKERVALEMSLVEGTAKFILACKNRRQVLEAAKTLLTARLRSEMLRFELNRLRRGRGTSPLMSVRQGRPSYAALSLSDIRVPLMWRRKDHINDVGDPRRFAVFCVARIGSQIYDSTMVEPVDRHSTDVTFPDVLLFNKVPSYFELKLEVYSHALDKDLLDQQGFSLSAVSATPKKVARSIGKAVGRTLMKGKESRDFEEVGPKFELVASANLTLDHCSEAITTCELYLEDPTTSSTSSSSFPSGSHSDLSEKANPNMIPLFGEFCFRLAALPYCCEEEVLAGPLELVLPVPAPPPPPCCPKIRATQPVWASLLDWRLRLWTDRAQAESARAPFDAAPVNRDTRIEEVGDDVLSLTTSGRAWRFRFPAEDKENMHRWLVHLIQHAADHRRWKQAAENRMEVYSPKAVTGEGRHMKRTRSKLVLLYNQTGN